MTGWGARTSAYPSISWGRWGGKGRDRVISVCTAAHQAAVALAQLARLGHGAEVAVRVDQRPVHEVAPGADQLVVVAADELGPREIGVRRLRPGDGEVEAQRVGVVAREEVAHLDHVSP